MKKLQNLIIKDTDTFNKAVKKLKKKYINIENELYLMFIYDKSEIENINEKEIDRFILELSISSQINLNILKTSF